MIIEDNDKMRSYIVQLIKEYAVQIIESDNGNDAIKLYDSTLPDAVLMDIELKGMDGISAAEKIKEKHPEAKIIFVTNYTETEYKIKAVNSGSYAYILKENLFELKKIIKELNTKIN